MVLSGAATVEHLRANLAAVTLARAIGEMGTADDALADWAEAPEAYWAVRRAKASLSRESGIP